MATIDEIRRDNLKLLREEAGGLKELSERTGHSESQLSQWINGSADSKTGRPRGMRPESCRRIEKAFKRTTGWMDVSHQLQLVATSDDDVTINQFDTGGSMGHGVVLKDQPGVIQKWSVNDEWLQKNVKGYTSAKNLCIVTGFGDSMRPMYNPGDPLIVDTGVKAVDYDAIYFFRVDNEGFIKRLQRVPGEGLMALSANKEYRDWTIKPEMDFEVFGRVIKVWRSEDF